MLDRNGGGTQGGNMVAGRLGDRSCSGGAMMILS
jgi:hypothetical protein